MKNEFSENGKFAIVTTTSEIYPTISLLLVLSQINTIAAFGNLVSSRSYVRYVIEIKFKGRKKLSFLNPDLIISIIPWQTLACSALTNQHCISLVPVKKYKSELIGPLRPISVVFHFFHSKL